MEDLLLDEIEVPFPVQWYEGMLLSPQHLQTNDQITHALTQLHWHAENPHHYGIIHLKIDSIYLNKGFLKVEMVKAIFPDGLCFYYNTSIHGRFLDLSLDVTFLKSESHRQNQKQTETYIYMALASLSADSSPIMGDFPRFISIDGAETKDINIPDNVITIPCLYPKVFLVSQDRIPPKTTHLPIAKVVFLEENFTLAPFTPPCFYLNQQHIWHKKVTQLTLKVRQKIGFLNERMQNQMGSPLLTETVTLLKSLLAGLPELEAISLQSMIKPEHLYWALVRSISALLPLRYTFFPPMIPAYNHNNLDRCIDLLTNMVSGLVSSVEEGFITIPFQQNERRFFLKLLKHYMDHQLFIGIRAAKGVSEYQLEEWVNDAIICGDSVLESTFTKRITGSKRRMVPLQEAVEFTPSRGVLVYEIPVDDPFIFAQEHINIINPADNADKRPSEIVLYQKKAKIDVKQ